MKAEKILQIVPKSALPDPADICVTWTAQPDATLMWVGEGTFTSLKALTSSAGSTCFNSWTHRCLNNGYVGSNAILSPKRDFSKISVFPFAIYVGQALRRAGYGSWKITPLWHCHVGSQSSHVPWVLKGKVHSHNLIFHSCYGRWIWNVNSCFGTLQHYSLAERIF